MSLFKSPSPPPVVMPPPLPKPDTSAIEARVAEQEARLEQQTKELERTVEQQEERAKAERDAAVVGVCWSVRIVPAPKPALWMPATAAVLDRRSGSVASHAVAGR